MSGLNAGGHSLCCCIFRRCREICRIGMARAPAGFWPHMA
jgi:hypothetical protein